MFILCILGVEEPIQFGPNLTDQQKKTLIETRVSEIMQTIRNTSKRAEMVQPEHPELAASVLEDLRSAGDSRLEGDLGIHVNNMRLWNRSAPEERSAFSAEHMGVFKNSAQCLMEVGNLWRCPELQMIGAVGLAGMKITKAATNLATATTAIGFANPILSVVSTFLSVFGLFSSSSNEYLQAIFQELRQMSQQMAIYHEDTREHFQHTFKMLDCILKGMEQKYYIILHTHEKLEKLKQNQDDFESRNDYYMNKLLTKKMKTTMGRIIRGNDAYFKGLGQAGFQKMLLDLMQWLEEDCFDPALNGYAYCQNAQVNRAQVIKALNAPVAHRLAYLAGCLGMEDPESMLSPLWLNDLAKTLCLLIYQAGPYYEIPMDQFDEKREEIARKTVLTKEFLQTEFDLDPFVTGYKEAANAINQIFNNWIDHDLISDMQPQFYITDFSRKYVGTKLVQYACVVSRCVECYTDRDRDRDLYSPEPTLFVGYHEDFDLVTKRRRNWQLPHAIVKGKLFTSEKSPGHAWYCPRVRILDARKKLLAPDKPYKRVFDQYLEQLQYYWTILEKIKEMNVKEEPVAIPELYSGEKLKQLLADYCYNDSPAIHDYLGGINAHVQRFKDAFVFAGEEGILHKTIASANTMLSELNGFAEAFRQDRENQREEEERAKQEREHQE